VEELPDDEPQQLESTTVAVDSPLPLTTGIVDTDDVVVDFDSVVVVIKGEGKRISFPSKVGWVEQFVLDDEVLVDVVGRLERGVSTNEE